MRFRSWPDLPTKGSPAMSSSRPGASPTNITSASGLPSPKTSCVAVSRRLQPVKPASASRNSSSVFADAARSCASATAISSGTATERAGKPSTVGGAAAGASRRGVAAGDRDRPDSRRPSRSRPPATRSPAPAAPLGSRSRRPSRQSGRAARRARSCRSPPRHTIRAAPGRRLGSWRGEGAGSWASLSAWRRAGQSGRGKSCRQSAGSPRNGNQTTEMPPRQPKPFAALPALGSLFAASVDRTKTHGFHDRRTAQRPRH